MNKDAASTGQLLAEVTLLHPFRVPGTNDMLMHLSSAKGFRLEDVGLKIRVSRDGKSAFVPWANVIGALLP